MRRLAVTPAFLGATMVAAAVSPPVPLPTRLEQMDASIVDLVNEAVTRVEQDPTSPMTWRHLGMVYHANIQYDLARQCYQHALALQPASARTLYYLALCHHRVGDTTAAVAAMEQVTVHDPTYIPAWWRLGAWHLEHGNLEAAEQAARRATGDPAGAVVLARVLLQRGAREEAAELLERQLEGHPGDRHLHMLLGTAYRQLGRTEDARRELTLGRGELPERTDPWSAYLQKFFAGVAADRKRAEALMEAGKLEQAVEILETLRVKRPHDVSLISSLAVAYRRSARIDEAITLLHEAIDIQSGYDLAHFHLAGAYHDKGAAPPDPELLQRALQHADHVVALSPTFAEGHGIRADILRSLGRNDDAVAALRDAIRCDSDNAFWRLRCGAMLLEMGEAEASIPLLETAADLDPSSVETRLALATAHLRLQQLEEARVVLLDAARLAPEHGGIQQTLQQIDQALRRTNEPEVP